MTGCAFWDPLGIHSLKNYNGRQKWKPGLFGPSHAVISGGAQQNGSYGGSSDSPNSCNSSGSASLSLGTAVLFLFVARNCARFDSIRESPLMVSWSVATMGWLALSSLMTCKANPAPPDRLPKSWKLWLSSACFSNLSVALERPKTYSTVSHVLALMVR